MKTHCIKLLLAAMFLLPACGDQQTRGENQTELPRGLAKADGNASCENNCDGQAPAGCWCDDKCSTYGDCCSDYVEKCVETPPEPTCAGACGGKSKFGCWCDDQCAKFGDCCADKKAVCDAKTCLFDSSCEANEFCKRDEGVCDPGPIPFDGPIPQGAYGKCTPKPTACTDHIEYVCGCDGKTYGNPCEADAAGVSVEHKGECKPVSCSTDADCTNSFCGCTDWDCSTKVCKPFSQEGDTCGGFVPVHYVTRCAPGLTCFGSGQIADAPGTCMKPIPVMDFMQDYKKYAGKTVLLSGFSYVMQAACTKVACNPQAPCCNTCTAQQVLAPAAYPFVPWQLGDVVQLEEKGNTLGCSGNNCNYTQNCSLEGGSWLISGKVRIDSIGPNQVSYPVLEVEDKVKQFQPFN